MLEYRAFSHLMLSASSSYTVLCSLLRVPADGLHPCDDSCSQAITHVCASMPCTRPGATVDKDCRRLSGMALDVAFVLSAIGRRDEDDCDVVLGAHNRHLQSVLCCRMRQLNPSKNHLNLLHTLHAISSMFFQSQETPSQLT